MPQLVFVHGRSQEHRDALALKAEWIGAFKKGLEKSNLELPIPEQDVRFPYYGQTLFDLASGKTAEEAAKVIVRGAQQDSNERAFAQAILDEVCRKAGITDSQIQEVGGGAVVERGILNSEWVQRVMVAIDRFVPHGSGKSIALFTHDVYVYLNNRGIRAQIERGVRQALKPEVPTVVVGHSLGTVVSYSLLRAEGASNNWVVPLYVTLGSPLAVTAIKKGLAPNKHPGCVTKWFNAMDQRDFVALYPLTKTNFPIDPEIENKVDVQNHTDNRHGIAGYLDDKEVAKRIHDALTA